MERTLWSVWSSPAMMIILVFCFFVADLCISICFVSLNFDYSFIFRIFCERSTKKMKEIAYCISSCFNQGKMKKRIMLQPYDFSFLCALLCIICKNRTYTKTNSAFSYSSALCGREDQDASHYLLKTSPRSFMKWLTSIKYENFVSLNLPHFCISSSKLLKRIFLQMKM